MTLRSLTQYTQCPDRRIKIVEAGAEDTYHWIYGPETRNPWPSGDFLERGKYMEPAYYDYAALYEARRFYREQFDYEEDLLVDVGL